MTTNVDMAKRIVRDLMGAAFVVNPDGRSYSLRHYAPGDIERACISLAESMREPGRTLLAINGWGPEHIEWAGRTIGACVTEV